MKFRERKTNVLYEAQIVDGFVLVRLIGSKDIERLSPKKFVERFDESYV